MAAGITIKIELDPIYVDYCKHHLKADEQGRLFASEKTTIGQALKSLLNKRPASGVEPDPKTGLTFVIPDYRDIKPEYYNYLSKNSRKIFADFLRKQFLFEMHKHIRDLHNSGYTEIKGALIHFLEQHNISPDSYNYETLKKEYYRYRLKKKAKNTKKLTSLFLSVLSYNCPLLVSFL